MVKIADCERRGERVLLTSLNVSSPPTRQHRGLAISLQHQDVLASPGRHIWERYEGFMVESILLHGKASVYSYYTIQSEAARKLERTFHLC